MKKLRDRKGSATIVIVVILAVLLIVIGLYIKMNWRAFKAEASFGFAIAMLIVVILLARFILIKHSIKKSRKEKELAKEQKRLEKEQEKLGVAKKDKKDKEEKKESEDK